MNEPRFLPSGKRLGPYFARRLEASPESRPFWRSVLSRFTTSSTGRECQAVASLAVMVFAAASMCILRLQLDPRRAADPEVRTYADRDCTSPERGSRSANSSQTAWRGNRTPNFQQSGRMRVLEPFASRALALGPAFHCPPPTVRVESLREA